MNVEEFYIIIGGDFDGVSSRLMTVDRIRKYLIMFTKTDDYEQMIRAFEEKRYEDAFRYAHNLKGIALNLGLTELSISASELGETVRHGEPTVDVEPLIDRVTEDYMSILSGVSYIA